MSLKTAKGYHSVLKHNKQVHFIRTLEFNTKRRETYYIISGERLYETLLIYFIIYLNFILALSSNLSKVINIICDWIIHIMRLALEY